MPADTSPIPAIRFSSAPNRTPKAGMAPARWLGFLIDAFVGVVEPTAARLSRHRRWIVVELEDDDLAFYSTSGARSDLLGHGSSLDEKARRILRAEKSSEIELRLLPEKVTQTSIKIPAGGLDFIEQIIDNRLDRLTPWKPDKVLYGFGSPGKPGPDGQVDIGVVATSREIASASLNRLATFGLTPSTMGSASEPLDQRLKIDLFRGKNDNGRRSRRRRIAVFSLATFAIMSLVYLSSLYAIWQFSQAIAEADRQIANARRMLVEGSSSMADRQKDLALISSKSPEFARFALIDRLASIIPDNTYLDEFDIQPGSLRIAGTSTEASALIKILQAEPSVSDARFSAPVTRQDDGRDRFDITAVLKDTQIEAAP